MNAFMLIYTARKTDYTTYARYLIGQSHKYLLTSECVVCLLYLKEATAFSNHTALQNGDRLYKTFFVFLLTTNLALESQL
jgi:hypothetical protein